MRPRGGVEVERIARRTFWLIAVTAVAALPLVALGSLQLVAGAAHPLLGLFVFAGIVVLSLRTITLRAHTDLSLADVVVLAGIVLLPVAAVAPLAALARAVNDAILRRPTPHLVRNAAATAVSSGVASLVYAGVTSLVPGTGAVATIPGAVAAAVTLVLVDVGQLIALLRTLPAAAELPLRWSWVWHTARAQLLWALSAVVVIEAGRIEPLFLVPGVPLLLLGYQDIRARFTAERRSRVLATLVEVSHAVGASLDPTLVFRALYTNVRASLEADAFYVALLSSNGTMVSYRFLVDANEELPPQDRAKYGTLAGHCIDTDRAILMRDAERDYASLGIERNPWGTVRERSIMVAPLRIRGQAVGAISAQSVNANAYDEGDLELFGAIANEAAVAIERAELYARTASLSGRLFELHRVGIEMSAERDVAAVARRLSGTARELLGSAAVTVFLDNGGDSFDFVTRAGPSQTEVAKLPKSLPLTARAMKEGVVEVADSATAPPESRRMLEASGHRAVLIYPLRAANDVVGLVFVTWTQPHAVTADERELLDILMNMGATALRSLRLYAELDEAYLATVQTLMTTIQARDGYREDHQRRVAEDSVALGERLRLPEDSLRDLRYASLFHALGKIGVAPSILSKQGPLTGEERRVVREHPILGARIIEAIRFLRGVVPIVRHANERWDGSGYPDGLAFEAIPYEARLLQIVLSYHAMLADRPYRHGLEPRVALGELRLLAGSRYDPGLVEEFVRMIEERGGVESAQLEVQEGARELAILAEITPQFNTLLDLKQLLDRVLRSLERYWPGSRIHILLRDEHTEELVVRAVAGEEGAALAAGVRLARGHGLASWVVEHREPLNVEDINADPRARQQDGRTRARMLVPLINEARAIGVLAVSSDHAGAFSQRDVTLLQAVGAQIAAAIEVADLHERLKHAANTDALTGLHNFRYFYDRLEEEIARAERRGTPLAVAYFDIDGLKRVNDSHGHIAGDAVLRTLGSAIDSHVRAEDVPARYGGDEFAIVMPETAREEAEKVVGRLMELLDSSRIDLGDERTIAMPARSWGVSSYPTDGTTAKELVENADTRAYARKRAKA
ncbi:MAG TPA: GAF domain-containing protein [Candidatus Limnocylindria bacterium]|nr:GAF domain-containing protein [Candidatus Limnocylindria bacterium]